MVAVTHNQGWRIGKLVRHDLFHFLLRRKLYQTLSLLLSVWTLAIMIFAGLYFATDRAVEGDHVCSLFGAAGPITYQGAFAFSLQTCTTVGYTLPAGSNAFFEQCATLQTLIFLQSCWSLIFNACLLGLCYNRVSRAESRSVQMNFSDKAIVSRTPSGQIRFQVRLYDVDAKHPVVEAKCRVYAVLKERSVPIQMRLIQPNDELGAPLFLSLPCVVAHHIDHYSAIHPPVELPIETSGLTLRQADSCASGREEVTCPVCGESFGTVPRWRNHVRNAVRIEANANYPVEGTHRELTAEQLEKHPGSHPEVDLPDVCTYFRDHVAEVIVVVSAQDPLTSGSFQALQSYRFEDIVFDANASFEPCIYIEKKRGKFMVDLERFHFVRRSEAGPTAPGFSASPSMIDDAASAGAISPPRSYSSDDKARPSTNASFPIAEGDETAEHDENPTTLPSAKSGDDASCASGTAIRPMLSSEMTGPSSSRISDSLMEESLHE